MAQQLLSLNFEIEGEKRLRAVLQVPIDKIKNLRPVWDLIRDDFAARNQDWLDSEGKGSFAPLSPAYAAWKEVHFPGMKILQRTRRLYNSLTDVNDADFIYAPEKLRVILGTKVRYGRYHQVGTRRMPRRPILKLGKDAAVQWARMIHQYLFESGQFSRAKPISMQRRRKGA
uniref:Putative tail protein n=1 Tax=viral metagenome TaxID=1070528 RepID=A0A6M3J2S8_9ZZZZ